MASRSSLSLPWSRVAVTPAARLKRLDDRLGCECISCRPGSSVPPCPSITVWPAGAGPAASLRPTRPLRPRPGFGGGQGHLPVHLFQDWDLGLVAFADQAAGGEQFPLAVD